MKERAFIRRYLTCTSHILLLAGLLRCVPAASNGSGKGSTIELNESYTIPLAPSLVPMGVRIVSKGAIVWSDSGGANLVSSTGSSIKTEMNDRVLAAEESDGKNYVLVSTAMSRVRIGVFDDSGRALRQTEYALAGSASTAVRVGLVWYAGGADDTGSFRLWRLNGDGSVSTLLRIPPGLGKRDTGSVVAHLSRIGTRLVVTLARSPYTIWQVGRDSSDASVTHPLYDPRIDSALTNQRSGVWRSLRGVMLDSGSLHTITDLGGDSRIVFVVDPRGKILVVKKIFAPLGFVDSDSASRKICAVRTLLVREIVCYDWRWHSGAEQ